MTHQKRFGFYKLLAWQKAHALTVSLYKITKSFPKEELFGITNQLRRASSSIGAQISEGSRMETQNHRKLYYNRAYASCAEVANFLELAHDLHYLTGTQFDELMNSTNHVSALLYRLAQSCSKKKVHM